ncbi:proline iminopeptidase Pip [Rubrivivax gelatinosus IL144]|uniref:Proline iminopeptidase n=2 Tax=Rubrivivax gelatinosus TaxID=28068 RepID=I0HWK0_RUBGI|nr:proline iminopeptidase Pip [Rubrivivax gelatinosus IL144]
MLAAALDRMGRVMAEPSPLIAETAPRRVHEWVTGDGHVLALREWGAAGGRPALVLHGGPGSGGSALLARVFDPARWRVLVPDQRGAGASRPRGTTVRNTTDHLLADLRTLRRELGITSWTVVGGSWGATLAVAHAADEPGAVDALLLRSAFLGRDEDLAAFFDASLAPAAWAALVDAADVPAGVAVPELLAALQQALHGEHAEAAALAWRRWERALSSSAGDRGPVQGEDAAALADRYCVQVHYLRHGCWLRERPLLARCAAVPAVPTLLLHADDDRVCRPDGARALAAALPAATLRWVPGAGHDPAHPAMAAASVAALAALVAQGDFGGGA